MEIILKQDVKNLGYADDVVKVKNGYGLNFLIPKGLGILASETNKKIHTETMKQRAYKLGQIKAQADKVASSLESITLTIPAKAGENGKLFGSVTSQQLVDVLKKMGYHVDKKQIHMADDHIKSLGSYSADLQLHRDVKVKLNFDVVES